MQALLKGAYRKKDVSHSELTITLKNGTFIQLVGVGGKSQSDAGSRLEGPPWNGGIIDEYARCPANLFQETLRPSLAETGGFCWFIGKPVGRNHQYDYYLRGLNNPASYIDGVQGSGDTEFKNWASFTWFSSTVLDAEEIEDARLEMDERTFRQEMEGSYESYDGQLYYNWKPDFVLPIKVDPNLPLKLSCDFNKSPMVWNVYQIVYRGGRKCLNAVDEIAIYNNAKTIQAARMFVERYRAHPVKELRITGDAANNHESHRDVTTDYLIMDEIFTKEGGFTTTYTVPDANPGINNRVNIVCSLLAHVRLLVSPKCERLIYDLDRNESDGKGAKEDKDKLQTHASDNLDYEVWDDFAPEFYKYEVRQR